MTVASTYTPPQYAGNGVTTAFAFPYNFFAASDLVPSLFNTSSNTQVSPAPVLNGSGTYDYTVTGTQDSQTGEYLSGGTVTFNNAPPSNYVVTIVRNVPATQQVSLGNNLPFPAKTVEGALDRVTIGLQQVQATLGWSLQFPTTDPQSSNQVLPPAALRANTILGFDANGHPIAVSYASGSGPFITLSVGTLSVTGTGTGLIVSGSASIGGSLNVGTVTAGPTTATLLSSTSLTVDGYTLPATALGMQSFAAVTTTNFTVPSGITRIHARCWGGGGGGGYGTAPNGGGGGGGGGYAEGVITVTPGQVIAITVGGGGSGGSGSSSGVNGGTSSVGSFMSATGGGGGTASSGAVVGSGGTGGTASGGTLNFQGQTGGTAVYQFQGSYGLAGNGGNAAGGGGSGGIGGESAGTNGQTPGGGGAGGASNNNGSAGAQGLVVLTW